MRDGTIQTVLVEALRAVEAEADNGRIEVERSHRAAMTAVAQPLELGVQHEVAFILSYHWKQHFDQQHAVTGGVMTVRSLREAIDRPSRWGSIASCRIFLFSFTPPRRSGHSGSVTLRIRGPDRVASDECELREQSLPTEKAWLDAASRAAALFGLAPNPLRTASEVARLTSDLRARESTLREPAVHLCSIVEICGFAARYEAGGEWALDSGEERRSPARRASARRRRRDHRGSRRAVA